MRSSKKLTLSGRLLLSLGLGVSFIFFLISLGVSAQPWPQNDPETAFARKADKLLKRVRQASIQDRITGKGRRKETSELVKLSKVVGIERRPSGDVVGVILKLAKSDGSELAASGFQVSARIGDIATLETEVDKLAELAMLSSVQELSADSFRYPSNDAARKSIGVEDNVGQRVVSQTGQGIVVGIVDTGIDFRHLDFTVPGSGGTQTKIKALLDMTVYSAQTPDPGWNYSLPGQSAVIGHLYSQADINAALAIPKPADENSDSVKQRDKNGHGTHVTGIAAGNGLSAPTSGIYAGMAPEADLIIVKANRQDDGRASFRTTDLVNALQFIQQQAAQLNKPFVINLSLGGHLGPHDGTTPDERAIDNLVNGGPGRVVCVGAGNDGDKNIHASGTVPLGGTLQLDFNGTSNPGFVELYHSQADRFGVTVTRPDGVALGPVVYDPNGFQLPNGQASDQYVEIFNANDDKGDSDPANDQPNIFLLFKPGALTGNWRITLADSDANANQPFDAWVEGDNVRFTTFVDNNSHVVASPGNAREAITVGAFVTRSPVLINGSFTPYTSPGPTADGRQKPDLEAPGHYLYSAKSTDITAAGVTFFPQLPAGDPSAAIDYTHYGGLAGTSMATAVTTGSVALFLQSVPSLTSAQIKDSLTNSTTSDAFTGIGWNPRAGFGKLNIAAAIQLGGRRTFTISGHVTNVLPIGMSLTLSGTKSATNNVNSSGNYSFTRLVEGGSYTITPSVGGLFQYSFAPTSYTFTNLDSNKVADFTATQVVYSVGGKIRDRNGNGVGGIRVNSQIFDTPFVTTNVDGAYLFTNLPAGQSYHITPSSVNYVFNPDKYPLINLSKNETLDFVALDFVTLSGTVRDSATGLGLSAVALSLQLNGTPSGTVQTDNAGQFSFASVRAGSNFAILPSKSGYSFQPNGAFGNNVRENQTINFTATYSPPSIGFLSNSASGTERNSSVNVFVLRFGDASAAATVDYRTIDDLAEIRCDAASSHAYARCDYATRVDTLNFGPGETAKVVSIPVIDDAHVESPETFQIEVLNPSSGTALDSIPKITITILDNDVPSWPNPIFTTPFFLRLQYLDFLSREPEPGEPWTGILNSCSDMNNNPDCDRLTVSAAFFGSPEFRLKGYFVYRFYKLAFNRLPAYSEIISDMSSVTGQTASEVFAKKDTFANKFVLRPEFTNGYNALSNAQYVLTLMGRYGLTSITTPDPVAPDGTIKVTLTSADLIDRLNGVGGTLTRAQVLRAIADSDQVYNLEFNQAFVAMQYFGYLRRSPETAGYNAWLTYLNANPNDFRTMVNGFMNSQEYRMRFGP